MVELLTAFFLAWVSTLSGVALGGFLVFRTKRDTHEALFQTKPPQGEAFNIDDGFGDEPVKSTAEIPKTVQEHHDRFVEQFAETLAEGKK